MMNRKLSCIALTSMLLTLAAPATTYAAVTPDAATAVVDIPQEYESATNSFSINKKSLYRSEFKLVASAGNSLGYTIH